MTNLSPIMILFHEFEEKYKRAADLTLAEDVSDGLLEACSDLEKCIKGMPATSAQDFAAKLIVETRYGDFALDDNGEEGLLDEALAILAVRVHPDAKLIEFGRQFEAAKVRACKLDPDRTTSFKEYEAARDAAGIPDLPRDQTPEQRTLVTKIYRDTGYKAASYAFNRAHGECTRLMKAIHRTKATTLEGFAAKLAAIAFDQADFELEDADPVDVAERMLYRVARDMAEVVKDSARKEARS